MAEIDLDPSFKYLQANQQRALQGIQMGLEIAGRNQMMEMRRQEFNQQVAQDLIRSNLQQAQANMYRQRVAEEVSESEAMRRDAPKISQYQSAYSRWLQNPDSPLPEPPQVESRQNQTLVNGLLSQADLYSARAQRMKAEEKAAAATERMEAEMLNDAVRLGATFRDQNGRITINQAVYTERKQNEVELERQKKEADLKRAGTTQNFLRDQVSIAAQAVRDAIDAGESPDMIASLKSQLNAAAAGTGKKVSFNASGYPIIDPGVPATLRKDYTEILDTTNIALDSIGKIKKRIPEAFGIEASLRERAQRRGGALLGFGRNEAMVEVNQLGQQLVGIASRAILREKGALSDSDVKRAQEIIGIDFTTVSKQQAAQLFNELESIFVKARTNAMNRLGESDPEIQQKLKRKAELEEKKRRLIDEANKN